MFIKPYIYMVLNGVILILAAEHTRAHVTVPAYVYYYPDSSV